MGIYELDKDICILHTKVIMSYCSGSCKKLVLDHVFVHSQITSKVLLLMDKFFSFGFGSKFTLVVLLHITNQVSIIASK